jgi:hypothetical protein
MSLELSLGLGDRRRVVFVAAELAILAVERGDTERAGCLWGAVESEVSSAPVAEWEGHHQELESPSYAQTALSSVKRAEGSLMSIAEAAGLDAR